VRKDLAFAFIRRHGNGQLRQEFNCFVKLSDNLTFYVQTIDPSLISLIEEIFPAIKDSVIDPYSFSQQVILTSHNRNVNVINEEIIDQFPGDPVIYKGCDSILDIESSIYTLEFLHILSPLAMSL